MDKEDANQHLLNHQQQPFSQNDKSNENASPYSNLYKAIILGLQFLCLFTAYDSAQNRITQIYEQMNQTYLGTIQILLIYFFYGIAAFFASSISANFNPKWVLFYSGLCYTSFIASGILISNCVDSNHYLCSSTIKNSIAIITASLCGISASTLWISQGWYIQNISPVSVLGVYNATFFATMLASQLTGSILTTFLLQYGSSTFFIALTILSAVILSSVILKDKQLQLCFTTSESKQYDLHSFLQMFKEQRLRPLVYAFILTGCNMAFYASLLYKLVEISFPINTSTKLINQYTSYVFIVLGCTEFFGSFATGYSLDKFDRIKFSIGATLLVEFTLVLTLIQYFYRSYSLCLLCGALWGLSDCFFQNLCPVLCSGYFTGRIEVLSFYRAISSLMVAILLIIRIIQPNIFLFILIIGTVEIITYVSMRNFHNKK